MSSGPRRGVTRGYVGALIMATVIVAVALLVAVWGGLALVLGQDPVTSPSVPRWAAPLVLLVCLGILAWTLWLQALVLLRGRRSPSWGRIVTVGVGVYLVWGLAGILAGMSIAETWLSPFAAALIPIWAVVALLFWAVLARRVYTDRPPPRWPWERAEEGE
ncbi:hypothetical protein EDF60_0453 [Leucobacter luti]|uniref:hypothetical protein n=1 Tax=Leucobacter luti TaxID=340320 RepID=UPI001046BFBE|nr:hypothetical protein [Leucobacter luti]MCW2288616.1 putative membrane protein [Leucobacter luti]TCK45227.1 hypothetical protein EDF60_0453 [Leucobacter luti]